MGLEKVTYVDGTTVITAQNLNAIQDSIIDLEASRTVPSNVRNAIYTLLENAAYATTGLEDEIAIVEAWAEEVTSLTLSVSTLSLNNDVPQTITATTVPIGATVTWSSSNNSVATVSDGVVTGVSNGSCVITASAGDLVATCDVTVSGFAVLESISAVYTQSGDVYTITPLNDLKADLVVTATYSDSSTETIPSTDYTLSGTLTVGTSTITVSYGGKTTTFNVIVELPIYALSTGEITKLVGSTNWAVGHGAGIEYYNDNQNRRSYFLSDGNTPVWDGVNNVNTDYYPIPIPPEATKVTVSITPSTQYHGEAFYSYSNGAYTREADPGWKQGSFTHEFTAGQYAYMTTTSKYNSAGTSYPTEPTEIIVQFIE